MALLTADAIILQAFPYSDTSRILRLLTRTHGVRSAIARGALRPKSRFGGVLEPFAEGVATLYVREGRDLQNLSGFDLTRSRQRLGSDLMRFGGASLLAEILLRAQSEESEPELFERVTAALDALETEAPATVESRALAEAWRLTAALGLAPSLEACVFCDRSLGAGDVFFDYEAGGGVCADCVPAHRGRAGRELSTGSRSAIRAILEGETPPLDRLGTHWHLLERFLTQHVSEGLVLRSLEFIAGARGEP